MPTNPPTLQEAREAVEAALGDYEMAVRRHQASPESACMIEEAHLIQVARDGVLATVLALEQAAVQHGFADALDKEMDTSLCPVCDHARIKPCEYHAAAREAVGKAGGSTVTDVRTVKGDGVAPRRNPPEPVANPARQPSEPSDRERVDTEHAPRCGCDLEGEFTDSRCDAKWERERIEIAMREAYEAGKQDSGAFIAFGRAVSVTLRLLAEERAGAAAHLIQVLSDLHNAWEFEVKSEKQFDGLMHAAIEKAVKERDDLAKRGGKEK